MLTTIFTLSTLLATLTFIAYNKIKCYAHSLLVRLSHGITYDVSVCICEVKEAGKEKSVKDYITF